MQTEGLDRLIRDRRTNAVAAWLLVAVVLVTGAASFLTGELLWPLFCAVVALIAAMPAISLRNVTAMPPWEVLLLAALPIIGHLFATTIVTGQLATYISVAALALLIAVDLDELTPVEMNDPFAVLFISITTMAAAGVWAVVRWVADGMLGTGFIESERALMLEFVASTAAGIIAGAVFVYYVRRYAKPELRLPEEVNP